MYGKDNLNEKGNSATEDKGIAMEIFGTLKKVMFAQWIIIGVLIAIISAQSFYHDYKWSEFDTVVVDGGDGGNAGYVGNDGDVNNYGESSGTQKEERQEAIKGNQN